MFKLSKVIGIVLILMMSLQTIAFADWSWGEQYDYTKEDMEQLSIVIAHELKVSNNSKEYQVIKNMFLQAKNNNGGSFTKSSIIQNNDWLTIEPSSYKMQIFYTYKQNQYFFRYFYQDDKLFLVNSSTKEEKTFNIYESILSEKEAEQANLKSVELIYDRAIKTHSRIKNLDKEVAYNIIQEGLISTNTDVEYQIIYNLNEMTKELEAKKVKKVTRTERIQIKFYRKYF